MATVLFAMPIKRGKTGEYKAFIGELLGSKRKEYEDMHIRYDLYATKIWIHTLDGKDYAMFTHEMGDSAEKRLANWSSSTHPFDQWFNRRLLDCYDIKDMENTPMQPEFFGELDVRVQT